ncbi:MAG: hypothetical protein D6714_15560 [Bacteroidetes bacterium]|nr:MAG: hypothetical protein D6714_15560 [Bacteroidota bacterium]
MGWAFCFASKTQIRNAQPRFFMKPHFWFCLALFLFSTGATTAQPARSHKATGLRFFHAEQFDSAAFYLNIARRESPADAEIPFFLGMAALQNNQPDRALEWWLPLWEASPKADPDLALGIARAFHFSHQFERAAAFYKTFLRHTEKDDPRCTAVQNDLRRCAVGLKKGAATDKIQVENAGSNLNSAVAEWTPILSPSGSGTLYFSRENDGIASIWAAASATGKWALAKPFFDTQNTSNEVLLDLDRAGRAMYLLRGDHCFSGQIIARAYVENAPPADSVLPLSGHIGTQNGIGGLFFYDSTTVLFSAVLPGGLGGLDLYWSRYENGEWSAPRNFGPPVNSAFDEVTPFLARDGQTLFFSSNNARRSMGGLDILFTRFDERLHTWSPPQNPGQPLNSANDDAWFRLFGDGGRACFASNRVAGLGDYDLYWAWFREAPAAADRSAEARPFWEVLHPEAALFPTFRALNAHPSALVSLAWQKPDSLLNADHQQTLAALADTCRKAPEKTLWIIGFTSKPEAGAAFWNALEVARRAADFLVENGMSPEKIRVTGLGNLPFSGAGIRPKKETYCLDFQLVALPDSMAFSHQGAAGATAPSEGPTARIAPENRQPGLSFKVQWPATAADRQASPFWAAYPSAALETMPGSEVTTVSVGGYQTYFAAETFRRELAGRGIASAIIVPCLNDLPIPASAIRAWSAVFPELTPLLNRD